MNFYNHFENIIRERLNGRDTVTKIIENIERYSKGGKIAFYPFGRPSRLLINEIKKRNPKLFSKIIAGFDKSAEVSSEEGVPSYNLKQLDQFKDISLLVIASNTFFEKQIKETKYQGKIITTSAFELSLPENMSTEELLLKIKEVYNLLADQKSKATYMIAWLSKLLNDESLTHLFESEEKIDSVSEPIKFNLYTIYGIDSICKKELFSELYKMKYVAPEEGDVVIDVGAYKGDTSIFFAHYVGKAGKVYAFEPIKPNYDVLVNNVKINKLNSVIITVNKGLSNKKGILKGISISTGAPWSYLSEEKEGNDIEVITLNEFVKLNNIPKVDFIKIDVEGLEEEVISGANEIITKMEPKLAIAIYHLTTDLFLLPILIQKLGNYKFYIRSKIEGPFGFTLYCKKK